MNGELAPKFWNDWGKIKKRASRPYAKYVARRAACLSDAASDLTQCTTSCTNRCQGPTCAADCNKTCNNQNKRKLDKCETNDFSSGMRRRVGSLKGLSESFLNECSRSLGGTACEQVEARPFCDGLSPHIPNYLKVISPPRNLSKAVDAFLLAFQTIRDSLAGRHRALSNEIKAKSFKCPKKYATKTVAGTNPAAGQTACILPQYKYNVPLASLLAPSPEQSGDASPRTQSAAVDTLDSFDPDSDLVGCTDQYCWQLDACNGGPSLVQHFWPTQIKNYFGVGIGEASRWNIGDTVTIGGEEFTITCIAIGAPNGGETVCGNTKASFDIVVVDEEDRPSEDYPTGTCVGTVR